MVYTASQRWQLKLTLKINCQIQNDEKIILNLEIKTMKKQLISYSFKLKRFVLVLLVIMETKALKLTCFAQIDAKLKVCGRDIIV